MLDFYAAYQRAPRWAQDVACSGAGLVNERRRYGGNFERQLGAARDRETWTEAQVLDYRNQRLRSTVALAGSTKYYRELFSRLGGTWEDFATPEGLSELPILTKSAVQERARDFCPGPRPRGTVVVHTSGTTGAGLRFTTTWTAIREQWAIWWRYRYWHGIGRRTWCGYFGGRTVVPLSQQDGPFWRYNLPGRQVIFSAYHQSPRTLPLYVGELRRRRLPWLHGYPSVLALLASYLETSGEDLGYEPRWVTTGAESLLPQQAEVIGRAFGVRPIEHYGEEEAVANASQCEHGFLHIDEDFSYVELLPWTGTGEQQIVGTSLCNPATVLLRYELTDTVRTHPGQCSCGRWGRRLEAVDGRVEDYLSLPDGSKIGRMDHVFKDMTSIHEAQIVQLEPGHIKVLVVPRPSWGPEAQRHLLEEIRTRVGGSLRVEFETCEAIPRTGAGKLRLVVSSPSCASSSR